MKRSIKLAISVVFVVVPAIAEEDAVPKEKLAEQWLQYMTGDWEVTERKSVRDVSEEEYLDLLSYSNIEITKGGRKTRSWTCHVERIGEIVIFLPQGETDDKSRVCIYCYDPDSTHVFEYVLKMDEWGDIKKSKRLSPQGLREYWKENSETKGAATIYRIPRTKLRVDAESLHYSFGPFVAGSGWKKLFRKTDNGLVKQVSTLAQASGWFTTQYTYSRPKGTRIAPGK